MNLKRTERITGRWMILLILAVIWVAVPAAATEAESSLEAQTEEESVTEAEETTTEESTTAATTEEPTTATEASTTTAAPTTAARVEETTTASTPVLSAETLSLGVGLTQKLTVSNRPTGVKVSSWGTSDVKIASVTSGGKVKAKRPGTAKITATLTDGTVLTCEVTVPEVTINYTELTLVRGKTKTLKVSGSEGAVTWSSSSEDKVSVNSSGKITALAYGSATVTAKIGYVSLKCKVTVCDPTLSRSSLYLLVGDSYTLTAGQYSGTVEWSSSKTTVATVTQKGVVTAKKKGTATISMKANGVTLTCKVTVRTAKLSDTKVNMVNGGSYKLTVTGSAKEGSWSSSDTSILTVSSAGTCKAKKTGEATVTYTVGDSSLTCYIVIAKKGATKTFGTTVTQVSVGISSLRNLALGSSSRYRFLQGSCTDGTYGYFLLGDKNYQPVCAIIKIRLSDWKIVKIRTGLKLYHGNDMTYKSGYLLVVNGEGNYHTITYVKASTLKIKKTRTLDEEVYGLAYNAKRKQYVVAQAGTNNLIIKNSSWKTVRTFTHLEKGNYTRQGIDCDNSYIYVAQSYLSGRTSRILVYNWNGTYITQITIPGYLEVESLFHVGNRFIVSYNNAVYGGGSIYTTAMKHYYLVQYAAGGGKGTQSYRMVKTGSGFTTASCKFTRKGYKFTGWSASRNSDGKVAYRSKKTGKVKWYKLGEQPSGYELYVIPAKKKVSSMSSTVGDCVTLTAVWKEKN